MTLNNVDRHSDKTIKLLTITDNITEKDAITFSKDFADSSLLSGVLLSYFPKEEKNILKRKGQQTT